MTEKEREAEVEAEAAQPSLTDMTQGEFIRLAMDGRRDVKVLLEGLQMLDATAALAARHSRLPLEEFSRVACYAYAYRLAQTFVCAAKAQGILADEEALCALVRRAFAEVETTFTLKHLADTQPEGNA